VTVALEPTPDGGGYRLTVSDTGPGIAPDELALVFERFYRGDSAAGDERGSGLGLAIVREIVERHGGRVRAEARAPHGLVIVVELPVGELHPAGAAPSDGRRSA
jgi:signal transduction histidine kinase